MSTPRVWAWRPPPGQTPQLPPLGVGLETCKACWDTPPPREQNSWHTLLKILPCPNFVAGGNKYVLFCCWWYSSLFTDTRPRRQRCRCGGWLTSPSCSNCTRSPTRLTTLPNETSTTTTPGSTTQAHWWVATSWNVILGPAYNFGYNEHPATMSRFLCIKITHWTIKKFS